jgi:hypothetical protein
MYKIVLQEETGYDFILINANNVGRNLLPALFFPTTMPVL